MIKYISLVIFTLLLFGCGNNDVVETTSVAKTKFLSIKKGISDTLLIAVNQKIVLTFTANLSQDTVNTSHIYLEYIPPVDPNYPDSSEPYPVGAYLEVDDKQKVIITPYQYFDADATYRVTVTTDVKDIYDRSLSENYVHEFQTQSTSSEPITLKFEETKPLDGDADVFVETEILMDFNSNLSAEPEYSGNEYLEVVTSQGTPIAGKTEVFNSLLKFIPSTPLPYDTDITVTLKLGLYSISGSYYGSGKTWSFKTKSQTNSPISEPGYKVLNKMETFKSSYFVRTLSNAEDDSLIVVARQGGIDVYNVNYHIPKSIPNIELNSTFVLASQITLLEAYYPFVAVGTLNDGMYLLEFKNGNLVEHSHVDEGSSIYGVHMGRPNNTTYLPDRIYTTNPNLGLKIYNYDSATNAVTFFKEVNTSIVGTSLDVIDYIDQDRKIYVADYNGNVVTLDENGTFISKVDMNGSVKQLFTMPNTKVYTVASSGIIRGVNYDGTISASLRYDIPSTVNDVTVYTKDIYTGNPYFATDKGFIVASSTGVDNIVNSATVTASVSVVHYDKYTSDGVLSGPPFLVSLSKSGALELFNAEFDDVNPALNPFYPPETADAVVNVGFNDVYLDHKTIFASDFELRDDTNSSLNPLTFTLIHSSDPFLTDDYYLDLDNNLIDDHNYTLTIKANNIKDMLGNPFNGGVDYNTSFTTQFQ